MIRNLGELLEQLRQEETARLDASDVKHGPTIGAMYEGLTQELLRKAIPQEFDLRIVSGFIIDGIGGTTGQLDWMLVRGEGTPVPYVPGTYQWHVRDVLAVIEIKKTLGAADLIDAIEQLRRVLATYSSWVQSKGTKDTFSLAPTYRAYSECVGETAPKPPKWKEMDPAKHAIFNVMMTDQLAPVRIIFGYHGYKTEMGLRRGFVKFLETKLNTLGYGPLQLPNLIVSNNVSLVKLGGHPYRARVSNDGYWPILASSHVNPTVLMLELLWTRISYMHAVDEVWGEDLEVERLAPLLEAMSVVNPANGMRAWMYKMIPLKSNHLTGEAHVGWEPAVLDTYQHHLVTLLCKKDVAIDDPDLLQFLSENDQEPQSFFKSLIETGLVAIDANRLVLTTTALQVMVLPDGRFVAADNNTGRLTRWVEKEMDRRRGTL